MSTGRVVVIGLGSRYRGDDGIGPFVLDGLKDLGEPGSSIQLVEDVEDALAIIGCWEGSDLALVIDAAHAGSPPGTVHCLHDNDGIMPRELVGCSSHGLGLAEAIELGRVLGRMPGRLVIYAVEVDNVEAGVGLSQKLQSVGESLRQTIRVELGEFLDLAR